MLQPVTPVPQRLRQDDDPELAVSLGYRVRLCLKKIKDKPHITIWPFVAFLPGVPVCLTTREALPNLRLEGIHLKMKLSHAQWTPNLEDPSCQIPPVGLKFPAPSLYLGHIASPGWTGGPVPSSHLLPISCSQVQ